MNGVIADIQRCSLHDGPGVRTSVFLKGCNMRCAWCHNPETVAFEPETLFKMENCIGCGGCEDECFAEARVLCGRVMTVDEVMEQVTLDKPYYGDIGGVTLTGGEPLCQLQFCVSILQACGESGIHRAVESNMRTPWDELETLLRETDLIMVDLKLFNEEAHRRWTGAGNALIMENIRKTSEKGVPLILRTPVIPGVNGDADEIGSIAAFAGSLPSLEYYELLPYHSLGLSKGRTESWQYAKFEKPEPKLLENLGETAAQYVPRVRIAGRAL